MEKFKDIIGFDGIYQIGELGTILSNKNSNSIEVFPHVNKSKYKSISLYYKGKYKKYQHHRLIAIHFIPNPENKPFINHINGIKTDNRIENLEWCTQQENVQHAVKTGLYLYTGWQDKKCTQLDKNGNVLNEYKSQSDASRSTGVPTSNINGCIRGFRKSSGGFIWK